MFVLKTTRLICRFPGHRDLEKEVNLILGDGKKKKLPKLPSEELQDFIHELERKFGTKVSLIGNNKKGRIYID